jgi:hypothetical protein
MNTEPEKQNIEVHITRKPLTRTTSECIVDNVQPKAEKKPRVQELGNGEVLVHNVSSEVAARAVCGLL